VLHTSEFCISVYNLQFNKNTNHNTRHLLIPCQTTNKEVSSDGEIFVALVPSPKTSSGINFYDFGNVIW
jgi:hypothetical protein